MKVIEDRALRFRGISMNRGGLAMLAFGQCPVGRWCWSDKKGDFCGKQAILLFCQGWAGRVEVWMVEWRLRNCPGRFWVQFAPVHEVMVESKVRPYTLTIVE